MAPRIKIAAFISLRYRPEQQSSDLVLDQWTSSMTSSRNLAPANSVSVLGAFWICFPCTSVRPCFTHSKCKNWVQTSHPQNRKTTENICLFRRWSLVCSNGKLSSAAETFNYCISAYCWRLWGHQYAVGYVQTQGKERSGESREERMRG